MCWNATVSINTFLLSTFAVLLAAVNKVYPWRVLAFIMSIAAVQFLEFIIWSYYDNKRVNKYASMMVFFVIALQPLAAAWMLYDQDRRLMNQLMIAYVVIFMAGLMFIVTRSRDPFKNMKSDRGRNGHLVWHWMAKGNLHLYMLMTYMVFFFTSIWLSGVHWLFWVTLATLAMSLYYFWRFDTWGTMWCWTSNVISLVLIAKVVLSSKVLCNAQE